jgi:ribosomal protein S18 acetylase RimI-like enzyme
MLIRIATRDDVAIVGEIGVATYRDHYASIWREAGLARWLDEQFNAERLARDLDGDEVRFLLAFDDGIEAPVGFAKLRRDSPMPVADRALGLELCKIYFRKQLVGAGRGGALLDRVVATARELSQPLIWLDVLKTNEGGVRFYERHGFQRRGEKVFATDLAPVEQWVMSRATAT